MRNTTFEYTGAACDELATLAAGVAAALRRQDRDTVLSLFRRYAVSGWPALTDLLRRCVAHRGGVVLDPNELVTLESLARSLGVEAGRDVVERDLAELIEAPRAKVTARAA